MIVTEAITVSIADLREGLRLLLDEVERRYGSMVNLEADYYWVVDGQAAYEFHSPGAPQMPVGQLSDDIASLRGMLAEDDPPAAIWHDLGQVVDILRGWPPSTTPCTRGGDNRSTLRGVEDLSGYRLGQQHPTPHPQSGSRFPGAPGLQHAEDAVCRGEMRVAAWWCTAEQAFGVAVTALAAQADADVFEGGVTG